ncbi:hypothetical protein MNEG_12423 [Monoraphidium neglectum]|uniref:Protein DETOXIFICATION n=1 Tax=Monoraphidium neglectum TaxID=145388 RepID=A0A0D2MKX8_9CHLO|nr:hypothetical protein MNEG_12423 [Monoraphidium neglectum]KIY95540.1 hypothetical protein MNEG_12423 [Monoraphidium neglectum]|eukprot:XP_013894560.1 hypothetical protein MNEG_12423 [Monoraphidium neglectum]
MCGALRGCGRQRAGFAINAAAYWGCGIPLAAAMALRFRRGVPGMWIGLAAGSVVQLLALSLITALQDWEGQVERSRDLVRSQSSIRSTPDLGDGPAGGGGGGGWGWGGGKRGSRSGGGGGGGGGGEEAEEPLLA